MLPFIPVIIPTLNYKRQLCYCFVVLERKDYSKDK